MTRVVSGQTGRRGFLAMTQIGRRGLLAMTRAVSGQIGRRGPWRATRAVSCEIGRRGHLAKTRVVSPKTPSRPGRPLIRAAARPGWSAVGLIGVASWP